MTETPRVPLYERLPEIYRTKDKELSDIPDQLQAYLALVEEAFGHIHENIEELYHDLFIETADEWVIPYIGDLLVRAPSPAIPGRYVLTLPTPSPCAAARVRWVRLNYSPST